MNTEQELRPCPFCGRSLVLLGRLIQKWEHPAETDADAACPGFRLWFNATPENVAAWNRRSSDEKAEVVGWIDRLLLKSFQGPSVAALSGTVYNAQIDDRHVPLYASPPAVAAGGVTVTDAMVEAAIKAADPDFYASAKESAPLTYQRAAGKMRAALSAALAVGDERMWENAFAEFEGVTAAELAATVARYGKALVAAKLWHEAEDKSLSKQPPTSGPNGSQRARLQHQEQIAEIDAALSPTPPSRGEGE